MSGNCCNTGYETMKTTWVKQKKYTLSTTPITKEMFGAFSISAAVRPPYSNSRQWSNPRALQEKCYPGVS